MEIFIHSQSSTSDLHEAAAEVWEWISAHTFRGL